MFGGAKNILIINKCRAFWENILYNVEVKREKFHSTERDGIKNGRKRKK